MRRRRCLVLAATLLALVTTPLVRAAPDLAGVYAVAGTNVQDRPYEGVVQIVKTDATYHLRWTFPPDGEAMGVGMVIKGDRLAVSYASGPTLGLAVYTIEKARLVGEWTILGYGGRRKEVLTRLTGTPATAPPVRPPPLRAPSNARVRATP